MRLLRRILALYAADQVPYLRHARFTCECASTNADSVYAKHLLANRPMEVAPESDTAA